MSATKNRNAILEALDSLPPLNEVAQQLITLMNDDRSCARDLDEMIRNDQALTARILKVANSSTFGKSRSIASLTKAVVLLGHEEINNMIFGISANEALGNNDIMGFSNDAWEHSVECAAAARAIAEFSGQIDPDQAFVAGLMHDIGLMVIASATPEVLTKILAEDPVDPLALERKYLGLNHSQVGGRLLDSWNLPVNLVEAVRFHHAPDKKYKASNPLVNIVALADRMTSIDGVSLNPSCQGQDLFKLISWCGLEPDNCSPLLQRLTKVRTQSRNLVEAILQEKAQGQTGSILDESLGAMTVFSGHEIRSRWFESVLSHLGQTVLKWEDLAEGKADPSPLKWLVVDLHGVSPSEREQLTAVLDKTGMQPVVVDSAATSPWSGSLTLPQVPSRHEFETLFTAVTV